MQLYKSYVFRTKDPVIHKIRDLMKDEGVKEEGAAEMSGVSRGTLHNWFMGPTMRPQHCTIMAVARSLGYDIEFVKQKKKKNGHASDE